MKAKLVGKGRTAEIWQHDDQRILKLYLEDVSEQNISREYKISQFVHSQGVRTPQPFELISEQSRQGIVFQQIKGPSLLKVMGEKPWKVSKYARMMARLHYDLHKLEITEEIGQQKDMLKWNIMGAPMLSEDEKSAILRYLEKLPQGTYLCHGDFHPDNVLMDDQLWVIDWMTGVVGEPAADAARSVVMFSMGAMPPGASALSRMMIGFIRKKLTKGYIQEYLRLSGLTYEDVDHWILPIAAARLVEGLSPSEKELLVKEVRKRLQTLAAEVS
ncbi:phosphotransferase family protein [Paenibacillus sp. NPDC058367]|uniref:phosphotransferase family protein n=1 Tax=Paenibacillus sp. NPDC058367 TaxID=3346460 RepID=UPI0036543BEC